MSLTRFVRLQLTIFSVLTVIGLVIMAVYFVRVPAMVGVGTIDVTADMPATGGLYVNANVTYNGDTIGKVKSVDLGPDSVRAALRIDSGADVPKDSTVFVKSMSAVGEQYVDFVPKSAGGPYLGDGDTVTVTADTQPVPIGPLLDQANELLATVPEGKLKTVVDEAFTAFNGSSDDLRTLIDSTKEFVDAANANVEPTEKLLQQAGPLLDTQVITSDQIRSWTQDLVTVTDQLRTSDPDIRKILDVGPGAAASTTALFQGLQPTLPLLLANLASTSQVSADVQPGPGTTAGVASCAAGGPVDRFAGWPRRRRSQRRLLSFCQRATCMYDRVSPCLRATFAHRFDDPGHTGRSVLQNPAERRCACPWRTESALHGGAGQARPDARYLPQRRGLPSHRDQPAVR